MTSSKPGGRSPAKLARDPLPAVSAIVLAGGRSSRFGRDKLREPLDDATVLDLVVEAAAALAVEVLVVVAPRVADRPPIVTPAASSPVPVRVVPDPVAHGGPGVGLRTGLEQASEPLALVVAGDMPRPAAAVLELLIRRLAVADDDVVDAVVLEHRGRRLPIPTAVRVGAAMEACARAAAANDPSLRGVHDRLRVRTLVEADWRPHDPHALTARDVDRPEDLAALR